MVLYNATKFLLLHDLIRDAQSALKTIKTLLKGHNSEIIFCIIKGIQAVRIVFFLFILLLKVANIQCFILIKCSEQEARFKKYAIMS